MPRTTHPLFAAGLSMALAACGAEDRYEQGPLVSGRAVAPSAPAEPEAAPPRRETARTPLPELGRAPAARRASESLARPAEPERGEARDLGAELRHGLSAASRCVQGLSGDVPARVRVDASARVLSDGSVGRATLTAPGLPDETRACFERVVSGLRFSAPVPGAPTTARASVTIERTSEPPPPPERAAAATSGIPIDDVPGQPIGGPEGQPIDDRPGLVPTGPEGSEIDDVPGSIITGPAGLSISN